MAVALYARVSTTRQAENDLSIPDQLRQMRAWCKSNGYSIAIEYIEPGASAKDGKRPVFQEMITDATMTPSPYEAIVVHSQSRFFRNSLEFALYEQKLTKSDVNLISITQQTSDDSAGEMARKLFSLFDEYQSKENSKHTLRAMKENARQGFYNGTRPPYGYKKIDTDIKGNRGRTKKRIVPDEIESEIVRKIYNLYVHGRNGIPQGAKSIASYLDQHGFTMRGAQWRAQRVNEILKDTTYIGQHYFNKRYSHNKKLKPKQEWALTKVKPILDKPVFEKAQLVREKQSPKNCSPRSLASPILLSGLIKCGVCGAGMTLMTGKSGQYRYYKCTNQRNKGNHTCTTPNIPMGKFDTQIREHLANKIFVPNRVRNMLNLLKKHMKDVHTEDKSSIMALTNQLKTTEEGIINLYEGIEKGVLELNDSLTARLKKLNTKKQETLIQLSGLRQRQNLPIDKISKREIEAFCKALKNRFNDAESGFGKAYIKVLVDEIRIEKKQAVMTGNYRALAQIVSSTITENPVSSVPIFTSNWRARKDSNLRPPSS
jgi:site-specific DNA recombinase